MANVLVTIRTEDSVAADIDGVDVDVFDAAGTGFITSGVTGSSAPGQVDLTLFGTTGPGTTYTIRLSKAGVSFLPEPNFSIIVTDPASPPNSFTFVGTLGLVGQLTTIHVQDDVSPTPVAVPGVRVRVFDAADSFVTEGDTDAGGDLTLVLAGAPDPGLLYILRFLLAGWTLTDGPTQTVQVRDPLVSPATNIFDIEATQDTLPASADPEMCLMSGFLTDQARRPLADFKLRFMPILDCTADAIVSGFPFPGSPSVVVRDMLLREAVFQADSNGYAEVFLPRGAIYEVHLHSYDMSGLPGVYRIQVPDSASAKLEDVLFPWVESLVWSTVAITVAVGDTEIFTATVTGSNDQDLTANEVLLSLLDFTIDDEAIARFSTDPDGSLLVTGTAVGVTTLSVDRIAGTYAPRSPDIPALAVTPATTVTITVTS